MIARLNGLVKLGSSELCLTVFASCSLLPQMQQMSQMLSYVCALHNHPIQTDQQPVVCFTPPWSYPNELNSPIWWSCSVFSSPLINLRSVCPPQGSWNRHRSPKVLLEWNYVLQIKGDRKNHYEELWGSKGETAHFNFKSQPIAQGCRATWKKQGHFGTGCLCEQSTLLIQLLLSVLFLHPKANTFN